MSVLRYDLGALSPAKRLADGRLVAEGLITRAGVFSYRNADGTERRELRPDEEVFRGDSLESFAMVPVTDDHPPELLDAKTARKYAVGTVGEAVRRDDDHVRARLTVYDAATIAKMEAGKVALSCGYSVDLDETPGVHPKYGRYDAVQRNVRGNHVAIVDSARAGGNARVRMDSELTEEERRALQKESPVDELKISLEQLAIERARADAAEKTAGEQKARAEKAEAALETANKSLAAVEQSRTDESGLRADLEDVKAKLEKAEAALIVANDPERVRKAVARRVKIERSARAFLGEGAKFDDFSDLQLMTAVINKTPVIGGEVPKDATEAWVESRFDSCLAMHAAGERGKAALREAVRPARELEAARKDSRSARERFEDEMNQMGSRPLQGDK